MLALHALQKAPLFRPVLQAALERLQWAPKGLAASWDAQKPAHVALAGLRALVEAQADHIAHLQARPYPSRLLTALAKCLL